MNIFKALRQTHYLLVTMILLQLLSPAIKWYADSASGRGFHLSRVIFALVVGVIVCRMPADYVSRIRRIREDLVRNEKLLILLDTPTYRLSIGIAFLIGVGLLSKYTMVFIYPVVLGFLVVYRSRKSLKRHVCIVILISAAMLSTWLLYAHRLGVLKPQANSIYFFSRLGRYDGGRWLLFSDWITKQRIKHVCGRLPFALGKYNLTLLTLSGLCLMRRRKQADKVVLLWIGSVFLPVIVMLPHLRYVMPAFPALAIVMAMGLQRIPEATERALAFLYGAENLYVYITLNQ